MIKDDQFKHLAIIAYFVMTKELGPMKVASLFDTDLLVEIDPSSFLSGVEIFFEL